MDFEHLYPESAFYILPHIDEAINANGQDLSEENLTRMTNDAVRRSTQSGDPPRGHSQNTLNDLARLLIIQRLIEQGVFVPFVPFPPFYVTPFPIPITPPHRPSHRPPNRFPHRR